MKLNTPQRSHQPPLPAGGGDVASTVLAVATRARSGARALSFRSGKRLIFVPRGLGDRSG